jgi:hypothetical protein
MLALLLLAAGMSVAAPRTARQYPRSVDQRVALLEAKELLQSQQLWSLQARLPPDALRALEDVQLHLARDQEQDERVRALTAEVQMLSQRLASLEMMLRGSLPEGTVIPVAPTQTVVAQPIKISPKKKAKKRAPPPQQPQQ